MARRIPFTEIVRDLPATVPFVGPEALERRTGRKFALRIGANESAFGVSPKAAAAMKAWIDGVRRRLAVDRDMAALKSQLLGGAGGTSSGG